MTSGWVLCCVFFFFKQKTAYEILRSDWSSDVCSSDLDPIGRREKRRPGLRRRGDEGPLAVAERTGIAFGVLRRGVAVHFGDQAAEAALDEQRGGRRIRNLGRQLAADGLPEPHVLDRKLRPLDEDDGFGVLHVIPTVEA